jgi:hypothetical protein
VFSLRMGVQVGAVTETEVYCRLKESGGSLGVPYFVTLLRKKGDHNPKGTASPALMMEVLAGTPYSFQLEVGHLREQVTVFNVGAMGIFYAQAYQEN